MSERTQEVDYFQYLPPSAGSQSAPTQAGQPDVRAASNQPQEWGEELTPEKYQEALARAEEAEKLAQRNASIASQAQQYQANERARQAQAVWDNAAVQAKQRAAEMHPDDAIEYLTSFHEQRQQALKQEAESMFFNFAANSWSEKLAQDYKLDPEDMIFLKGRDPDDMEIIAKRIASKRDAEAERIKGIEEQIGVRSVSDYVEQRVRTGAYQTAGGSGRQPAFDPSTLSVRDHLRHALTHGDD